MLVKYILQASEEHELFSNITDNFVRDNLKNIKMNSLGEWSALPDNNDVTFFNWESWWAVDWDISVSLLISVVFWDIMEIVTSDNNGSLHFSRNNNALKDLTSNGYIGSEWTFLIDISWLNGFLGSFES